MIKNLRELRQSKGVSQQKIADAIHVSQQSVNKYENHNIEPDINTLIKIADYFNVSVDYLIGRTEIQQQADALTLSDLSCTEEQMIKKFRLLSDKQKEFVVNMVESYILI